MGLTITLLQGDVCWRQCVWTLWESQQRLKDPESLLQQRQDQEHFHSHSKTDLHKVFSVQPACVTELQTDRESKFSLVPLCCPQLGQQCPGDSSSVLSITPWYADGVPSSCWALALPLTQGSWAFLKL